MIAFTWLDLVIVSKAIGASAPMLLTDRYVGLRALIGNIVHIGQLSD